MKRHPKANVAAAAVLLTLTLLGLSSTVPAGNRLGVEPARAAGECPNEAQRELQQFAADLPDCRAYEQVSPVDKEGVEVNYGPGVIPGATGAGPEGVFYSASGAFADSPSSALFTMYGARRTGDGWDTSSFMAPTYSDPPIPGRQTRIAWLIADDLTRSVVLTPAPLAPGGIDRQYNTYLKDVETGEYEFVYSSGSEIPRYQANGMLTGTPSLDHLLFDESGALTPDAVDDGLLKLYEFSDGHLRLVSPLRKDPGVNGFPIRNRFISDDGSRIFYDIGTGGAEGVWMTEGDKTVPLSVSRRPGDGEEAQAGIFVDASRDGSVAYFISHRPLTEGSWEGNAGFEESLYRYDVDTGELTDLTANADPANLSGPAVQHAIAASPDGSRVYFEADGKLTADAELGVGHIYMWRQGQGLTLVAQGPNLSSTSNPGAGLGLKLSPNGLQLAFVTVADLGFQPPSECPTDIEQEPAGPCGVVYHYNAETDHLSCVSCPSDDSLALAHASLVRERSSVTDSGQVFFQTRMRLSNADGNGQSDVYGWEAGRHSLISSGTSTIPSHLLAVGDNGRNVYFTTDQQLVPSDSDDLVDVYDARIGGGLASQLQRRGAGACLGDACLTPVGAVPPVPAIGSATIGVQATARAGKPPKCAKRKHKKKDRRKHRGAHRSKASDGKSKPARKRTCARSGK